MPRSRLLASLACVVLMGAVPLSSAAKKGQTLEEPRKVSQEEVQNQEAAKHYQFANQFMSQGLLKQANDSLDRALSLQPVYPEASYLKGAVLIQLNDFQGAIAHLENALAANPFLTEAHNLMGTAYAKMGDLDHALKEFEAVKGDISFPTPEVPEFNIGMVFWEKHACGEAIVHFRKALDINPEFWRGWYLLGDCQEQMGQRDLARESYLKAVSGLPDDVNVRYRLAIVCFQSRDWACARENFTKVRDTSPGSDLATGAREYLRQMDFR